MEEPSQRLKSICERFLRDELSVEAAAQVIVDLPRLREIEPGALTLAMPQPGRAKEVIEWGPERRWVRLPQDTRDDKVGELMVHLVRLTTRRYAAEQITIQEASQEIFLWLDLSLVMTGQAVSGIMVSEDDASASTPHGVRLTDVEETAWRQIMAYQREQAGKP